MLRLEASKAEGSCYRNLLAEKFKVYPQQVAAAAECASEKRMATACRKLLQSRQVETLLLFLCLSVGGAATIRYSVAEEMESGSFVANVAKDLGLEVGKLAARGARLVSEGNKLHFRLHRKTGDLFVKEKLDRESLCGKADPCVLHFEVVLVEPLQSRLP